MPDDEEIEHPDQIPEDKREPELDADELLEIPDDGIDLPADEEVPEDTKGS